MRKASKRQPREQPSAESLAEIPELDFSTLRRIPNPYAGRTFVNLRVLESDVEAAFPDSEAVNKALRVVMAFRDVMHAKPAPTEPHGARARPVKKRRTRAASSRRSA
jgi:hypothetical protein